MVRGMDHSGWGVDGDAAIRVVLPKGMKIAPAGRG